MYRYTVEAFVESHGDVYCAVTITVFADNEKDAIKKAKQLVDRKSYVVSKVEELDKTEVDFL